MTRRIKELGMSLIELMVAMAIGLVVMLVVFQLFSVSEGTRRTSVAGSDAQMSAAIAITALQDQIRNGGYGLIDRYRDLANTAFPALGCNVVGNDVRGGTPVAFNFPLAPVTIAQGANNNGAGVGTDSDTITVVYSDLPFPTVPTNLMQNMATATDPILVNNRYGIRPGDVLLLVSQNTKTVPNEPLPAAPSPPVVCRLFEATGTPTNPPSADPNANSTVQRGTASYFIGTGLVTVRYNSAAGTTPLFTTDAAVYNLGRGPARVQFQLVDTTVPPDGIADQLTMTNFLGAGTGVPQPQALVEGVVALQAQYGVGVDTTAPPDGLADQFDPGAGFGAWQVAPPAQWGLVLAVRFAVLARSNIIERKDPVSNQCTATPATSPELTWAGGTFDLSHIPDWQCYRYKRFEAVVPLRNMIWMPT
jgi:type IV pilus assembly protein PilW